jgi:hypothetical protein
MKKQVLFFIGLTISNSCFPAQTSMQSLQNAFDKIAWHTVKNGAKIAVGCLLVGKGLKNFFDANYYCGELTILEETKRARRGNPKEFDAREAGAALGVFGAGFRGILYTPIGLGLVYSGIMGFSEGEKKEESKAKEHNTPTRTN